MTQTFDSQDSSCERKTADMEDSSLQRVLAMTQNTKSAFGSVLSGDSAFKRTNETKSGSYTFQENLARELHIKKIRQRLNDSRTVVFKESQKQR